ncbi:MAG: A/G-specific adenine glycosylase [Weeksellaceae bacterium]|jgi:A/G-specific adenine glycosylase|nr:A/G-specific adenine glycosylase [Weeksellaceae bacterium]MDX9704863.1 A/G-specific adenine glycosylase [Weeksellaceae bacterium]
MTFNSLILIWFDKTKRNLPWRNQSDPYKIWISEIILQQTRVAQGLDYYLLFCEKFPTIFALAHASEQEVLKLWQGLGYYSRARNMHFTARQIVNNRNGEFPSTYKELLTLKGVGEYTAAAIASIAFQENVPAIDGNAFRVLSRYFNIHQDISLPKTKRYFMELGKEIIDKKRPGDFNQAVMELGATVCLPKNPKCEICPLNESCEALAKNTIAKLPVKTKKTKITNRYFHFFEIRNGQKTAMIQRTQDDVWKNLFTFPMIESKNEDFPNETTFLNSYDFKKTHQEVHILSHQRLYINFWKTKSQFELLDKLSELFQAKIYDNSDLNDLPLPRPIEKFLAQ